jgi:hypothetical protein
MLFYSWSVLQPLHPAPQSGANNGAGFLEGRERLTGKPKIKLHGRVNYCVCGMMWVGVGVLCGVFGVGVLC